ncbi:phosphotransferase enzyme family protein [Dyadobacter sp. NIV53]|uniref:phosphotransferase enzyme family protein n=1 Tax=Dyadobacter sp. NIV53 TaxID=2861765 RepID=UPI001C88C209|nr:phosphotransferase [Dyadobacter sp. NIV53]
MIFPTQYSMLSTEALKSYLEEAYGLNNLGCKLLIHNVSDTYLLAGVDDKYIFKLYRDSHRKLDEIKAEVELLNILKENGAKISYPVTDLKGGQIQSFNAAEGIRNGVLFSFAEGKPTHDYYDSRLQTIGREMAHIHNITADIELQNPRKVYDVRTTLIQPLEYIKSEFTELPEEYAWLQSTTEKVVEKIRHFDLSKFSYGYCHYDFLPHNFHFDEHDNITFFDFDFAGKGLLANDMMTFYVHFFFQVMLKKQSQEEADKNFQTFISAYRQVRAVSEEELAAIPYLGFAFWVFFLEFYQLHFEDWSNTFYNLRFKKERMGWIRNWVEWYCRF